MVSTRSAYDTLPYESLPIPGTSPARLSMCSIIHGGPLPPIRRFRVLEIGCNDGSNLLPMAFYNPGAEFVGIDRTETALAAGRVAATQVGLSNLRLDWMDLNTPGTFDEPFHYILMHGVFSWVDARIRQNIFELCDAHLSPQGLVYLSHNVKAGWSIRGLVRDVLMEAMAGHEKISYRNELTREAATSLEDIVSQSDLPYHQVLAEEFRRVCNSPDSYLAHETLAPVNVAFRHDEVVSMMKSQGFTYLADALYNQPEGRPPAALAQVLSDLEASDDLAEHLADVLGYRRFRFSVFSRAEALGKKDSGLSSIPATSLFVADVSPAKMEDALLAQQKTPTACRDQVARALKLLDSDWPGGCFIADLMAASSAGSENPVSEQQFLECILSLHMAGQVELGVRCPQIVQKAPTVWRPHSLARYQVSIGQDPTTVWHRPLRLSPVERLVVRLLGEDYGVDDVLEELARYDIAVEGDHDQDQIDGYRLLSRTQVEDCLKTLGRWGLLE